MKSSYNAKSSGGSPELYVVAARQKRFGPLGYLPDYILPAFPVERLALGRHSLVGTLGSTFLYFSVKR